MFRTVRLSIIRSFSLYTQQWYVTYTIAVCTVRKMHGQTTLKNITVFWDMTSCKLVDAVLSYRQLVPPKCGE